MHDIMHNMESNADRIREHASRKIFQARAKGLCEATIVAGDIVREMHLNNRVPAVCSALVSKKFLEANHVSLESQEGPPKGVSTTMKYTYRFAECISATSRSATRFSSLRGAGRSTFELEGGGEVFLRQEREAMDRP